MAVAGFKDNAGGPKTLSPQADKLRERFALERSVLAGERGMIAQAQAKALRERSGVGHSVARFGSGIQMDLLDERNLFKLTHPGHVRYPGTMRCQVVLSGSARLPGAANGAKEGLNKPDFGGVLGVSGG